MTVGADGTLSVNSCRDGGFRIPAYDAKISDGFRFPVGKQFSVSIYYKSISFEGADTVTLQFIRGERYGDGYIRNDSAIFNATVSATETPGVITQVITNRELKNSAGEVIETLLYRGNNDSLKSTVVIDKITITDPSVVQEQTSEELLLTGSIRREKTAEDGTYTSAGIRFRGRVSAATRAAASEIGFVAVPTAYLNGASIADYVATEGNKAIIAKVKSENSKEIVYENSKDFYLRDQTDYQLIMTGLTVQGLDKNLLNTKMTVALYVVVDGVTTYTNTLSFSYNDIAKYY